MKQLIKQHRTDIIKGALILLWGILCFAFFQSKFCYHFYHQEQTQLFLLDSNYISTYFQHPAWLACMVGDFLTQLYYYMFAGAIIVTLALLTLGDLCRRSLEHCFCYAGEKKIGSWIAFGIAIILMTVAGRFCINEGCRLSSIIAVIGGIGMFWIMDICAGWFAKGRSANKIFAVYSLLIMVGGVLAYTMFGMGFWFFFWLELLRIPGFGKQYGLKTWRGALPMTMLFIPLLLFILPIAPQKYYITIDDALTYPGVGKWTNYDDEIKFEQILAFDNEYYFGHYGKVIDMYEHFDGEPTEEMSFFYCLSLSQMHMLPEKMMNMKKPFLGTFLSIDSDTPLYTIGIINELYYIMGDMTYTERAALLANTFTKKGRNVRMIKRLAEANLINGDIPAAMKYLRMLEKTLVYKQWAIDHEPQTMSVPVKMEIDNKHQYINTTGRIRIGDSCYTILTQLLDSNPDNLVALDYLLCSDMLSHERETFVMDYEKYDGSRRPIFKEIYESALSQNSSGSPQ